MPPPVAVQSANAATVASGSPSAPRSRISKALPARSPNANDRPSRPTTVRSAPDTDGTLSGSNPRRVNNCVVTACLSLVPAHETRSRPTPAALATARAKSLVSHSVSRARTRRCGYEPGSASTGSGVTVSTSRTRKSAAVSRSRPPSPGVSLT